MAAAGGQIVHKFDICTRKTDKLLDNIGNFFVSANGEKALYEQLPERKPGGGGDGGGRPAWPCGLSKPVDALGKPPEPNKPDGRSNRMRMEVYVDPRAEWEQMFREVWRIERDFFYDPNLHGANMKALMAIYQPYVDNVMSRSDLNYIFGDMLGEITAQHVYISGGDLPDVKHVSVGLLGADYTIDQRSLSLCESLFWRKLESRFAGSADRTGRERPRGRISAGGEWARTPRQRRDLQLLPWRRPASRCS